MSDVCPICGGGVPKGGACSDHFDLMLVWEWEYQLYDLHHLMVLGYYLQHPERYSGEGLEYSLGLLRRFAINSEYVVDVRQEMRAGVQQNNREFPITPRPGNVGAYPHPVTWTMRAADVIAAGHEHYYESIRAWADSIVASLREAKVIG